MRMAINNRSLKQQVVLLRAMQEMRAEMDRVWRDFFDKNPDINEEEVRRWLEKRLRNQRNLNDQHNAVRDRAEICLSTLKNQ